MRNKYCCLTCGGKFGECDCPRRVPRHHSQGVHNAALVFALLAIGLISSIVVLAIIMAIIQAFLYVGDKSS